MTNGTNEPALAYDRERWQGSRAYTQRLSDSQAQRLEELADLTLLARSTYFAQGDLNSWKYRTGSVGEDEYSAAAAGNRHANMATHAPAIASVMLRTASEQLAGLAAALRACEVFGAPEPLVRSVLENSAYACWVMDPQTNGTIRGARVLAAELTTTDHLRRAIADVSGTENDEHAKLSERFQQLKTLAEELYDPFVITKDRSYTVGGERYPSFTTAVTAWADGPGGGRVSGRGMYGLLCSDTHPKGLASRLNWQHGPDTRIAEQHVTIGYLERLLTAALSPFYSGLVCLASYHGWLGNPALAEFETEYMRISPNAIQ